MTELELAALEVVAAWKALGGDSGEAFDPTFVELEDRALFMEAMGRLEAASGFAEFRRRAQGGKRVLEDRG